MSTTTKPRPRFGRAVGIALGISVALGLGVSAANALSIDSPEPNSKLFDGPNVPSGTEFSETDTHYVPLVRDGECIREYWVIPVGYERVGDWMTDTANSNAKPDLSTEYELEFCAVQWGLDISEDGLTVMDPYSRITSVRAEEEDFIM
ncbi:hypothetical protein [Citricoccus nitrophenolicus]|uniref:hypothetical protein n=1 Tax=Citricoccus nitrophenolicus TaxID=863575 RepID=UPI0031EAA6D0